MGTLPLVACPATGVADGIDNDGDTVVDEAGEGANDEDPDPWPADFNDDQAINVLDILQLTPPVFNASPPDPNYSQRKDINADGTINILDFVHFTPPMFNSSCTP